MHDKNRVYLRALELNDYKVSLKWRNDNEIWSMLVGPKYFVSEAYEKKWVENNIFSSSNDLVLAICYKENNEHIGYIYLNNIDWKNKKANSSILIGEKNYWGKGLGVEAIILMLNHAFNVLGLERVEARQLLHNVGSIKVHEKCGYKTEGLLRKAIYKDGEYRDLNLMSILREDFDDVIKNI